jgi:hypothetical protein
MRKKYSLLSKCKETAFVVFLDDCVTTVIRLTCRNPSRPIKCALCAAGLRRELGLAATTTAVIGGDHRRWHLNLDARRHSQGVGFSTLAVDRLCVGVIAGRWIDVVLGTITEPANKRLKGQS